MHSLKRCDSFVLSHFQVNESLILLHLQLNDSLFMPIHNPIELFNSSKIFHYLGVVAFVFSSCQAAYAADVVVSAEVGQMNYHMIETGAAGNLLNREDGVMPTQRVSLRWESMPRFVELSAWKGVKQIPYAGFTQIGFPLSTRTDLNATGWQLRTGQTWSVLQRSAVSLSLGLDSMQMDRNILPAPFASPLREKLDSTRALLGAEFKTELPTPMNWPLIVSAGVDVMRAVDQRLSVNSYGIYDLITLNPTPGTDLRARFKLSLAPSSSSRLWLAFEREEFNPGSTTFQTWAKNGVPAALVRYPGSHQTMQSISVGASWQF